MSNSKNIIIPARFESQIQSMLARLQLEEAPVEQERKQEEDIVMCEVKEVIDHRVSSSGEYQFKLSFTDGDICWVNDSECDAEYYIRHYLSNNAPNVRTIYCVCRVSSKTQAGPDHVSLDAQASRLVNASIMLQSTSNKPLRTKIVKISASAYKGIPSALQEIADVAQRDDFIAIYRVDRLSRNIEKYMEFLNNLYARGVKIYSQNENLWFDDKNKLRFYQCILSAQMESKAISERVHLSLDHRRKRGDASLGSVTYGYCLVREDAENPGSRLVCVQNDAEQEILTWIYTWSQQGNPDEWIATELNRRGLKKRSRTWTADIVHRITRSKKRRVEN